MRKQKIIKVICDDREPKSMDAFALIVGGIEFERKRLKTGDYILGDICIERKEINDFCTSIIDGRLESQVVKMKRDFKYNYIIVVGRVKDRTSDIHEHCILGKMTNLIVKHDMKLLFADDEFQFCYLLKSLFTKTIDLNNVIYEDEKIVS